MNLQDTTRLTDNAKPWTHSMGGQKYHNLEGKHVSGRREKYSDDVFRTASWSMSWHESPQSTPPAGWSVVYSCNTISRVFELQHGTSARRIPTEVSITFAFAMELQVSPFQ